MSSRRDQPSGKAYGIGEPNFAEFVFDLHDLQKESDRGLALAAAAFVDDVLFEIISAFLAPSKGTKDLFEGPTAPLATLSARIGAANALGLISNKDYRDAHLIRRIRNEFAHRTKVTFEQTDIGKWCEQLLPEADDDPKYGTPRGRFLTATISLVTSLRNRARYASKQRLAYGNWPE